MSHDGLKFDSVAELHRWRHLCMLQQHGLIADLRRQVAFELVRGVRFAGAARARPAIRYVADFVYTEKGVEVIEDVKGMETAEFKLKRHLMQAQLAKPEDFSFANMAERGLQHAAASALEYLVAWPLDIDLNQESLVRLFDEEPAANAALWNTYRDAISEGRLGN